MVRRILSVAAFALLVEGCSGAQTSAIPNPGVNAAQRQLTGHFAGARPAVTESILHEFTSTPDGAGPYAGLVNVKGTLYGTTTGGGTTGYGTVFKISPSGKLSVLYSFSGTTDGANPYGNLVDVNGTLYGTTAFAGGSGCYGSGCGTVFKITTSGKESTIYSFKGGSTDGAFPEAGLIYVKGALYGTTAGGGTNSAGSVFKLTTSGKETVLHIFTAGATASLLWRRWSISTVRSTAPLSWGARVRAAAYKAPAAGSFLRSPHPARKVRSLRSRAPRPTASFPLPV